MMQVSLFFLQCKDIAAQNAYKSSRISSDIDYKNSINEDSQS